MKSAPLSRGSLALQEEEEEESLMDEKGVGGREGGGGGRRRRRRIRTRGERVGKGRKRRESKKSEVRQVR